MPKEVYQCEVCGDVFMTKSSCIFHEKYNHCQHKWVYDLSEHSERYPHHIVLIEKCSQCGELTRYVYDKENEGVQKLLGQLYKALRRDINGY